MRSFHFSGDFLVKLGVFFLTISVSIFVIIFYPVLKQELLYIINSFKPAPEVSMSANKGNAIVPADKDFSIVIPKIRANSKVIKQVDPYNPYVYQRELAKGVAHAKGSALPDKPGNVFLFAHSSQNYFQARRYNSVFYLLTKLEKGDEIYVFYNNKQYKYQVTGKRIVDAAAIQYIKGSSKEKTLTLMTCWPPGTTFKRLLILARS